MPKELDTCFIESLKGSIPDALLNKIKMDVRSEFVSLPKVRKVAENNGIMIEVKLAQGDKETEWFGDPKAKHSAKICKVEQHFYKYIKDTGVTSYFLNNYEAMKHKEDGHLFSGPLNAQRSGSLIV